MSGRLSLVGTPIGNLGDITLRAVECLKAAERIFAEDTRRTRVLLSHLGIEGKKLISLHAHSSERAIQSAIEILTSGKDVALVTDAGMPAVSDPGSELVRAARIAHIDVTVVPGPSAVTSAVALSGLVDGPFSFFGFLPRKGTKRADALRELAESNVPVVLFESPHRIKDTLSHLARECGTERQIAITREITKKYEETLVVPLGEASHPDFREVWQGEFTLVVEKSNTKRKPLEELDIEEQTRKLLAEGHSVKDIATSLCKELAKRGEKVSRRELYSRVLSLSEGGNA